MERLAASLEVAGRENGHSTTQPRAVVTATVLRPLTRDSREDPVIEAESAVTAGASAVRTPALRPTLQRTAGTSEQYRWWTSLTRLSVSARWGPEPGSSCWCEQTARMSWSGRPRKPRHRSSRALWHSTSRAQVRRTTTYASCGAGRVRRGDRAAIATYLSRQAGFEPAVADVTMA